MMNILKTLGRKQSHASEAQATANTVRTLDIEALESVTGGKTPPPSGASFDGGGHVNPPGSRDPRAF
jgi:hypothetical protein